MLKNRERLSLDVRDQEQIRLEEDSGVGTAKHYKLWKRSVCLLECLHVVSDSELALLIVGTAQDALDTLEINNIVGSRG